MTDASRLLTMRCVFRGRGRRYKVRKQLFSPRFLRWYFILALVAQCALCGKLTPQPKPKPNIR